MLPLRWFGRKLEPLTKANEHFPFLSTSAVDPKLLISIRQRRNWSLSIPLASSVVIASLLILLVIFRAILWLHAPELFLLIGVGCIVLVSVFVLWLVPRWQVSSLKTLTPEARFDKKNESRKTLAQIIGGLFVIASLFFTVRTLQVSQEQAAISSRQAETAAKQVQIAQEGQFTDRYIKAIDQLLRKDQLEIRLGAIYALERIANDSPKDHWPVVEVLTTYVRENAPRQEAPNKTGTDKNIRAEIQAILTVLGRRDATKEGELERLDLQKTDLVGAHLTRANLSGADLTGADLSGANLSGANLSGAYPFLVDLSGANLTRADLTRAYLAGADLTSANLTGADLTRANFVGANFVGADLIRADLTGTYLTSANLTGADLTRANFVGANFVGADLIRADLTGADFTGADLSGALNLNQNQINSAEGDYTTQLPPGLTYPEHWPKAPKK